MQVSTTGTRPNGSYALMRLGFIILLVLSPLLPYMITMAYNSYLMATIPARIEALPVYPNAKLGKEFIRRDTETNRCLVLIVQYGSTASQKSVDEFYESTLLQSGWHTVDGPSPSSHRYAKSSMTIQISDYTSKSYRIYVTFDIFPIFQPGCLP